MRLDNRSCNLHDLTTGAVHWSAVCTSMDFVFFWIPCDNVQVLDYTLSKACWSPHLSPQSSMSWLFYCILSSMAPGHISIRLSASRCLGWVGMWKGGGGLLNQVVFFFGGGGSYTVTMSYTIFHPFHQGVASVSFSGFLSWTLSSPLYDVAGVWGWPSGKSA